MQRGRQLGKGGELAAGTIDSCRLWHLAGGKQHATGITNACRTSLFNIHTLQWDDELLSLFNVPRALLPDVQDNSCEFGRTDPELFGESVVIGGMAGDQHAALIGQACFEEGMAKATYGTGCFMLLNTGEKPIQSNNRLLTTIGYRIGNKTTYALEGSIFVAGAGIKWLRDGLQLITHASQTDDMATRIPDSHGVYMVPAFVGLGAPHWDPEARGMICGLTLGSTQAHIARAMLESVAYQTYDLVHAMRQDGAMRAKTLRIDGGMAAMTGLLSSWPVCSRLMSSARSMLKPRRLVRLSWRDCMWGFGKILMKSLRPGSRSVCSLRRWTRHSAAS